MNTRLLYTLMLGTLAGCGREADIQPGSLPPAVEAAGTYRTNFYLDPSGVALSAGPRPSVELRTETDSTVMLAYATGSANRPARRIPGVLVQRQPDGLHLSVAGQDIGTLRTERIFLDNGLEKQGQLLRLDGSGDAGSFPGFAGYRP